MTGARGVGLDWQSEIFVAHLVKQKVASADSRHVWEHHFPEVAASEADIAAVERGLGFALDADYRDFLRHANGWRSFFQAVDLFGTGDLLAGSRFDRSMQLLNSRDDMVELSGFGLEDLLPIAVSMDGMDVFAISKSSALMPGVVFWFAGQSVDSFDSFGEWFLAMVDYNRREGWRLEMVG